MKALENKNVLAERTKAIAEDIERLQQADRDEAVVEGALRPTRARLSAEECTEFSASWDEPRYARKLIDHDVAQGPRLARRPHEAHQEVLSAVELPFAPLRPPALP